MNTVRKIIFGISLVFGILGVASLVFAFLEPFIIASFIAPLFIGIIGITYFFNKGLVSKGLFQYLVVFFLSFVLISLILLSYYQGYVNTSPLFVSLLFPFFNTFVVMVPLPFKIIIIVFLAIELFVVGLIHNKKIIYGIIGIVLICSVVMSIYFLTIGVKSESILDQKLLDQTILLNNATFSNTYILAKQGGGFSTEIGLATHVNFQTIKGYVFNARNNAYSINLSIGVASSNTEALKQFNEIISQYKFLKNPETIIKPVNENGFVVQGDKNRHWGFFHKGNLVILFSADTIYEEPKTMTIEEYENSTKNFDQSMYDRPLPLTLDEFIDFSTAILNNLNIKD